MTGSERTCNYCSHYLVCKLTDDMELSKAITLIHALDPPYSTAQICAHFIPKDRNLLIDEMWRITSGIRNMGEDDLRDVLFSEVNSRFKETIQGMRMKDRFAAETSPDVHMMHGVAGICCEVTAKYLKEQFNKVEGLKDEEI